MRPASGQARPATPRIVLACDTSTRVGSIAILEQEQLMDEVSFGLENREHHSRRLLKEIEALLIRRGLAPRDLDLLVVSLGPGSFTGVRTALSTMKGLAWALHVPLAGVCGLEALASPLLDRRIPVLAALDARKNEVYAAAYAPDGSVVLAPRVSNPEAVAEALAETADGTILGVGEGVVVYRDRFQEVLRDRLVLAEPSLHAIRASVVARLGLRTPPTAPDLIEPMYLRRPEAEVRRAWNLDAPHSSSRDSPGCSDDPARSGDPDRV